MKKKFKEREYDATIEESKFEKLLRKNEYEITGVCECNTLTKYLIKKENIEFEWLMPRALELKANAMFTQLDEYFLCKKKFLATKRWEVH